MMEMLAGRTRNEWEQDLMRMRAIIGYHAMVQKTAREKVREKDDRADYYRKIDEQATGHVDTLCRILALAEYLIGNYEWRDAPKAVQ